jgi:hypothetical protein
MRIAFENEWLKSEVAKGGSEFSGIEGFGLQQLRGSDGSRANCYWRTHRLILIIAALLPRVAQSFRRISVNDQNPSDSHKGPGVGKRPVSRLRDEARFEMSLKHHANVERRL